jgi:polysaccharide pyruvyl transferase WcaK-like protein
VHVVLIPFGINKKNDTENDLKLYRQIMATLNATVTKHVSLATPESAGHNYTDTNVYITYIDNIIRRLDFALCARFHAHVLCMNHQVPFLSISTTRKVTELLNQYDMVEFQYLMQTSHLNAPIDFDVKHFYHTIRTCMQDKVNVEMRAKLHDVMQDIDGHIVHFKQYLHAILSGSVL